MVMILVMPKANATSTLTWYVMHIVMLYQFNAGNSKLSKVGL